MLVSKGFIDLLYDPWAAKTRVTLLHFDDGFYATGTREPGNRGYWICEECQQILHGGAGQGRLLSGSRLVKSSVFK
jgi:hypothetical protein